MASEVMNRPVDVYYPDLDVWVRGTATSFLPEVGRLCVQFPDGSKRLLSADKHVYRFADEVESVEPSKPTAESEGVDLLATHVSGADDVDVGALRREQAEQEAWLRSFSTPPTTAILPSSLSVGQQTTTNASKAVTAGPEAWLGSPLPHSGEGMEEEYRQADNQPSLRNLEAALSVPDFRSESAVYPSVEDTVVLVQPSRAVRRQVAYQDGFVHTDTVAETVASSVLRQAHTCSQHARELHLAGHPSACPVGLLAVTVLCGRNMRAFAASFPSAHLSVRVCLVQAPLSPMNATEVHEDGFLVLTSERLHVPTRINPYTCKRTLLYRTPPVLASDTAAAWDARATHSPYSPPVATWQEGYSVCGLVDAALARALESGEQSAGTRSGGRAGASHATVSDQGGKSTSVLSTAPLCDAALAAHGMAAQLDWWHLSGFLLFQIMLDVEPDATATQATSEVPKNVLVGQCLLRICDIFAGNTHGYSSQDSALYRSVHPEGERAENHAGTLARATSVSSPQSQEFSLRVWLPARGAPGVDVPEVWGDPSGKEHTQTSGMPPALYIAASIVLPTNIVVPDALLLSHPTRALTPIASPPTLSPFGRGTARVATLHPASSGPGRTGQLLSATARPTIVHTSHPTASQRSASRSRSRPGSDGSFRSRPSSVGGGKRRAPSAHTASHHPGEHASSSHKPAPSSSQSPSKARPGSARYGTAWQAMGAKDLPENVTPDDPKSVRVHLAALHHTVSALEVQLQSERVNVVRRRADLAKAKRLTSLVAAHPSPILNIARARVSQYATAAATSQVPTAPLLSPAEMTRLQAVAAGLQQQVTAAAALLAARPEPVSPPPLSSLASSGHSYDALSAEELRTRVAGMRGRVGALRERIARREALARR